MKNPIKLLAGFWLILGTVGYSMQVAQAEIASLPEPTPVADSLNIATAKPDMPAIPPTAPSLEAQAYILVEAQSGKILAQKDANVRRPPASLTKMMTLYVVSSALKSGQITLDTEVPISQKAWEMSGSKMFVKVGDNVKVRDLIKGIIVDSGNDACVALAEYLGGNEPSFAVMMNQEAQKIGMTNSHFTDSTGLPDPNHYTTPQDLAILARALIYNFPEYYPWFKQKWFTYAGIRQPNRNRLLWRDSSVDGLKTGHTDEAGFCLVASAQQNTMRLISVVLNDPSDSARASDSEALLNYGFHFFETKVLYKAGDVFDHIRVWKGERKRVAVGLARDVMVTIPLNQSKNLTISQEVPDDLNAPIKKGKTVGYLVVKLQNEVITKQPLIALESDPEGAFFTRTIDAAALMLKKTLGN